MSTIICILLFISSCTCGPFVQRNDVRNRQIRAFANVPPQEIKQEQQQQKQQANVEEKQIPTLDISKVIQTKVETPLKQEQSTIKNATIKVASNTTKKPEIESENPKFKTAEMESGAMMRGVLVVVALSILFISYLAIKTYCVGKKRVVIFKKYGIRVGRNDVEMTPLPLDEDEDDETVFDVGNIKR